MPNYNTFSDEFFKAQLFSLYKQQQELPLTAFKDVRVANLTPQIGWTFIYNINSDLVETTTTGNGMVSQNNSKAILETTANEDSSALVSTKKYSRYIPGLGLLIEFTCVFTHGVTGSTQFIGIGDDLDGLFFGFNGESFGVLRRQNGTEYWAFQNEWNMDKLDGSGPSKIVLNQSKGNIYVINFQWLGYGLITFSVVNPDTGNLIPVHQIRYANTQTNPHIFTPNLPLTAEVKNTTNNTNIKLETVCAIAHLEGISDLATVTRNSISSPIKSFSANTETNILTISSKSTFHGNVTASLYSSFFHLPLVMEINLFGLS